MSSAFLSAPSLLLPAVTAGGGVNGATFPRSARPGGGEWPPQRQRVHPPPPAPPSAPRAAARRPRPARSSEAASLPSPSPPNPPSRPCTPSVSSTSAAAATAAAAAAAGAAPGGPADDDTDAPPWSADFVGLVYAQLSLLAAAVGISRGALFVRREHGGSGDLEFVPLAVHPPPPSPRSPPVVPVWAGRKGGAPTPASVVAAAAAAGEAAAAAAAAEAAAAATTPTAATADDASSSPSLSSQSLSQPPSRPPLGALPGGIPASRLLPDYPFIQLSEGTAGVMADGGLYVPLQGRAGGVAAVLTVWRGEDRENPRQGGGDMATSNGVATPRDGSDCSGRGSSGAPGGRSRRRGRRSQQAAPPALPPPGLTSPPTRWSPADREAVVAVARTVALAASLEGRWSSEAAAAAASSALLLRVRSALEATLHQVGSPLASLTLFGTGLLRRLPVGDPARHTARAVLREVARLGRLLGPLDPSGPAAGGVFAALPPATKEGGSDGGAGGEGTMGEAPDAISSLSTTATRSVDTCEVEEAATGGAAQNMVPTAAETAAASLPPPSPTFGTGGPKELVWVSEVLGPVIESAAAAAAARGISLTAAIDEDAPPVLAVAGDLAEAAANVLDNAVKYTSRGGAVSVSVAATPASDEEDDEEEGGGGEGGCRGRPAGVEVWVRDNGRGIAAADLPRVLERGFRGRPGRPAGVAAAAAEVSADGVAAVDPTADDTPVAGSGLGLAIVAEVLAAAGGCVRVESPPAGGTAVCLWLPRAKMRRHLRGAGGN